MYNMEMELATCSILQVHTLNLSTLDITKIVNYYFLFAQATITAQHL